MEFTGYDAWRTTDPADTALGRSDGRPTPWHCRDCERTGKGIIAHVAHWRESGHVIRFGKRPDPKPMVTVCAWCPDHVEATAAARAHGYEVSHGICAIHKAEFEAGR